MILKLLISFVCLGIAVDSSRVKRQSAGSMAASHGGGVGLDLISEVINETIESETDGNGCGHRGGCLRGYCWAGCDATVVNNEWCWTTRGGSQNYQYVQCSHDGDCNRCWRCAGTCAVG